MPLGCARQRHGTSRCAPVTLLESVIAMVILAVVAVACLEGSRGAAQLEQRAGSVADATARAESELTRAMLGQPVSAGVVVRRVPYAPLPRLDRLEVEVPRADGRNTGTAVKLSRLVDRR